MPQIIGTISTFVVGDTDQREKIHILHYLNFWQTEVRRSLGLPAVVVVVTRPLLRDGAW